MPTSAIIILIIVVWLFVLAPWLLRSQRPVSHTGDGFEDTRVLYSGGSGKLPATRRPRVRPREAYAQDALAEDDDYPRDDYAQEDSTQEDSAREDSARDAETSRGDVEYAAAGEVVEAEVVEPETVDPDEAQVVDAEPQEESTARYSRLRQAAAKARAAIARPVARTIDGEVVAEPESSDGADVPASELEAEDAILVDEPQVTVVDEAQALESEVFTAPVIEHTEDDAYELDETYLSPVDLLYPGAVDTLPASATDDLEESADHDADGTGSAVAAGEGRGDSPVEDTELSAEEIAFAQSRKGRGGWDPVAEKAARKTRFRKRQRSVLILVALLVVAVAAGIVLGGWAWAGAALLSVVFVCYLIALRNLTRAEQQLYRRRVAQLRRARLGVRNAQDEELAIPRKLRHPGAVVLEADDASPDFEFLPLYDGSQDVQPRIINRRDMRDELSDRRVS